jgi:hypothetical protein
VAATVTTCPQKITFGEMRESGTRDVLIYCRDHRCGHHIEINADCWADDARLSEIEPKFLLHQPASAAARRQAKLGVGRDGDRRVKGRPPDAILTSIGLRLVSSFQQSRRGIEGARQTPLASAQANDHRHFAVPAG